MEDRGDWHAIVREITKSPTWLSDWTITTTSTGIGLEKWWRQKAIAATWKCRRKYIWKKKCFSEDKLPWDLWVDVKVETHNHRFRTCHCLRDMINIHHNKYMPGIGLSGASSWLKCFQYILIISSSQQSLQLHFKEEESVVSSRASI